MNPELPQNPRQELESRLTALLLGELPAEQAAGLREMLAHDTELARLYDRLKTTIELVRETEASPVLQSAVQPAPPQLSEQKREQLLAHFKTVAPKEFAQPRRRREMSWLVPVSVAALLMVMLGAMMLPALSKAKSRAQRVNLSYAQRLRAYAAAEMEPPAANTVTAPRNSERVRQNEEALQRRVEREKGPGEDTLSETPARARAARPSIVLPSGGKPAEEAQPANADANGNALFLAQRTPAANSWFFEGPVNASEGVRQQATMADSFDTASSTHTITLDKSGTGSLTQNSLKPAADLPQPAAPLFKLETRNGLLGTTSGDGRGNFGGGGGYGGGVGWDAPSTGMPLDTPPAASTQHYFAFGLNQKTPDGQPTLHWFDGTDGTGKAGHVAPPGAVPPGQTHGQVVAGVVAGPAPAKPSDGFLQNEPAPLGGDLSKAAENKRLSDLGLVTLNGSFQTRDEDRDGLKQQPSAQAKAGDKLTVLGEKANKGVGLTGGNTYANGTIINGGSLVLDQKEVTRRLTVANAGKVDAPNPKAAGQAYSLNIAGFLNSFPTTNSFFVPPAQSQSGETIASAEFFRSGTKGTAQDALGLREKKAASNLAQAKENLENLQKNRQMLYAKIASESTDLNLPKSSMVDIVDRAVPPAKKDQTLWERFSGTGEYKSTARIKAERDQSDISGIQGTPAAGTYDPYFVQTEFEAIQSQAVLGKVVKEQNLEEKWRKENDGRKLSSEQAVALLKKKLELHPAQNNGLLEIGVKSDDPQEAARLANAVAEAYQANRIEQRLRLPHGGIQALEQRWTVLDAQIQQAQKELERLQPRTNAPQTDVAAPKPAAGAPVPQPEVQTRENAFSTFSLNVSDVSFKLAAASLEKGVMPEPAGIRSEEFINAFDYRDPEPAAGVPVAFAWERAQYPFAHNRDLLRFSLKTAAQGRQSGRPLNLVLLLDNSGSMERADRVRIIREALRVLAGQLHAQDKLSVITFARTPRLWVDGVPGTQAGQVAEQVGNLTPQGGTNLEEAMNLAYQTALRHYLASGINRVVLLTDGAANLGDVQPERLKQKVEDHRKQGIALDCFGIGWEGLNDDLLEVLSRNGDGRYGFLNTPEEAATGFAGQLAGALRVAASDVKVQVEFNPKRVTAYRQIGYAKHQLKKEQFRDNTVDAAELGAAESGNALYVLETNPAGEGPLASVRIRYKVPGTRDYREQEWAVPYAGTCVSLDQASPAMRLAATASAFSEWLASSPYAAEVTSERLLGYLRGVPDIYGADPRPRKLEWMLRQAKSITGR